MKDFTNVNKKDSQIRNKINNMLDENNRLPYNYQVKIGYDSLIHVVLKELINVMGVIITDIDIELKMKTGRIKILENKNSYNHSYMYKINERV